MLHHQMRGGTPLRAGKRTPSGEEPGRGKVPADVRLDGLLDNFPILLPALELSSGDFGGGSTGGSIGIDKIQSLPVHRQSRSIRGGVPAGFRPGRQADAGRILVEEHLPECVLCEGKIFRLLSGQIPQRRGLPPAQQRQQNPLRHGPPAVHSFRRHRQGRQSPQLLHPPPGGGHGSGENQLLLGPGHAHVQHPHLLGPGLPAHEAGYRLPGNGGIANAAVQVNVQRPQPQAGMNQHRGLQVSPVEPFPQVCQEDNGEFQSLGLVDAHDLHAAGGRAGCGNRLLPALQQAAEMGYESKQSLVSRALKAFGMFIQGNQVLPASPAAGHGAEHPQNIPLVVYPPDQPVDAHIPRQAPQVRQPGKKFLAVLLSKGGQGLVEITLRVPAPDQSQPVRRKTRQR